MRRQGHIRMKRLGNTILQFLTESPPDFTILGLQQGFRTICSSARRQLLDKLSHVVGDIPGPSLSL